MARDNAVPMATRPAPVPTSKLPAFLRFPLLVVLGFATSMALYSGASEFIDPQLRAVCRSSNEDYKVASSIAWRLAEMGLGWFASYDDIDLISFSLLTHSPWYYLLYTFYDVQPATIAICLSIDAASLAIPTRLLRPRAPAHNPRAAPEAVPNRSIINDFQTVTATSLLGSAIYSVVLSAAFLTFLPSFMVVHFEGLVSLVRAHAASLVTLFITLAPLGYAAREFLLTPSLSAQTHRGDAEHEAFNPETAGLVEHLMHNFWWGSKKTRVLIKRTATLVVFSWMHSFAHAAGVLEGGDVVGAAGYSGVWAAGSLLSGLIFRWVENV
ncbi:uncharacterized protein K452DRAFT_231905 [Aplosporella prunicola CBS 121167]|uniref:Uncharacterized protein n=1 Tax=Aplosporella prunicola CBS 121167 TaxID=1176127 RepID=A0A6A6BAM8_9PEZI|nr:uncharacterized protein K452DRAFT_231905 [Aplosporella prunicola CBS 121167]KAF2139561.1 hypothetical protein K452DRAFT_231905 [Aplosporella prunicola CBS 121167]